MGNKVVVALLSIVVILLAAVLVVGVIFLSRDTRSKATQLREADYDRCVTRIEAKMESWADLINGYYRLRAKRVRFAKRQDLTIPESGYRYYNYDLSINRDDGTLEVSAAEVSRLSKHCRVVLK